MHDSAPQPHNRDGDDDPALRELKEKQRRELIGIQLRDQKKHPRDVFGKVRVFGIAEDKIISRYPVDAVEGIIGGSMRFLTDSDLSPRPASPNDLVIEFDDKDGGMYVRGDWSQEAAISRLVAEVREFVAHVRGVCPLTEAGDYDIAMCRRTLIRRHGQLTLFAGMVMTKAKCSWNEPTPEQLANGIQTGTIDCGRGRDALPDTLYDTLRAITFSWLANHHNEPTIARKTIDHLERLSTALAAFAPLQPVAEVATMSMATDAVEAEPGDQEAAKVRESLSTSSSTMRDSKSEGSTSSAAAQQRPVRMINIFSGKSNIYEPPVVDPPPIAQILRSIFPVVRSGTPSGAGKPVVVTNESLSHTTAAQAEAKPLELIQAVTVEGVLRYGDTELQLVDGAREGTYKWAVLKLLFARRNEVECPYVDFHSLALAIVKEFKNDGGTVIESDEDLGSGFGFRSSRKPSSSAGSATPLPPPDPVILKTRIQSILRKACDNPEAAKKWRARWIEWTPTGIRVREPVREPERKSTKKLRANRISPS